MWFTAKEMIGYPEMPASVHKIRAKLDKLSGRDEKVFRQRASSKAFEYHISSLPEETQKHLAKLQLKSEIKATADERKRIREKYADGPTGKTSEEKLSAMTAMTGWPESRRNRCFARHEVLMACDQYIAKLAPLGIKREAAREEFIGLFNRHELPFDEAIYEALKGSISKAGVWRWKSAYKKGGIASLDGHEGVKKDQFIIELQPEMKRFALAFMAEFPHAQARKLRTALNTEFQAQGFYIPAEASTRRWLVWWKEKNASLFTSMSNPDAWKNSYMVAFGCASDGIERLNQLWELDATPADLECTLPDGSKRRYHITALIDVWSRAPRLLVTETPRTESNAALMRRALLSDGKPEKVKLDNGSDYISKAMLLILDMLEIEYEICPPFSPWKKPHIERFFGFFSHDLLELKPGFVGHDVADRKAIEARKTFAERLMQKGDVIDVSMTPEELQVFCDDWVDNVYMHKYHEGLKATPFEAKAGYQGEIASIANERALDQLLSVPKHGGLRTVAKKGIKIDNIHYIAGELAIHVGQQVQVRLDKDDLGQIVVSDLEGAFICVAVNSEYKGVNRQEIATEATRLQREHIKEAKKEIRAAKRKFKVKDVADRIMDGAKEEASKVIAMPKPATEYTNTAIQGAADAAEALENKEQAVPTVTQEQMDVVNHMMRDDQKQDETEEDRFRRWLGLNDKLNAEESLDEFNSEWKARYETTPEFKGRHMVWEDFGDSAFR